MKRIHNKVKNDGKKLLSIDFGTLRVKCCIYDAEKLRIVAEANAEYSIDHPEPLWTEQNPTLWWEYMVRLIKSALKNGGIRVEEIAGIGISNMCPSLTCIDEKGRALRPAILYPDQRSIKQSEYMIKKIGLNTLFEITGNRVASGTFSATSILWLKENEADVYAKTNKFLHANGYVAYKLTGKAAIDWTNASLTGLFNITRKKWAEEIIEELELDAEKLPPILPSYQQVAEISREAAKETGLSEGTPVVIGAADTACTALGLGVIRPRRAFETTGSSSVLGVCSDLPKFDIRLLNRCHVADGLWLHMGAMSTTGASLRWFRDQFCIPEIFVAKNFEVSPYKVIDDEAATSSPGARGLIFLPYMMGKRCPIWDPYARGAILGLSLAHKKGDIARAILEGVAYGLRHNLEIIETLGIKVKEVRVAGGGAKSRLWRQIKASVLRKRIMVPTIGTAVTLGAAILAGVGAGLYPNCAYVADKLYSQVSEVEEPNSILSKEYDKYYRLYRECYERLKPWFRNLKIAISGDEVVG